jgi:hypothetical protein
MPEFGPHPLFAEPYIGATPEPESKGDEYIALSLRWPKTSAVPLYLRLTDGPRSLVELGFDEDTHRLCSVTLVIAPPDAWSVGIGTARGGLPVEEGLPRCDPAAWIARTRTGSLDDFRYRFYELPASVRVELGPTELVLLIGGLAGPAVRELASGRVRCGVDARGAFAYLRLTPLSAREAELLAEFHLPDPLRTLTGGGR